MIARNIRVFAVKCLVAALTPVLNEPRLTRYDPACPFWEDR